MKTILNLFVYAILFTALIEGGGLANLAVTIYALMMIVLALVVTSAYFGRDESAKAILLKDSSAASKILMRILSTMFIGGAAYEGFVMSSIIMALLWLYSAAIMEAEKQERKEKQTKHETEFKQWQERKRGRVD